jgi:hypothetical protein
MAAASAAAGSAPAADAQNQANASSVEPQSRRKIH